MPIIKPSQDVLTGKTARFLKSRLPLSKRANNNQSFAAYQGLCGCFEGLCRTDSAQVENGLLQLIKTHEGRIFSDLQYKYFHTEAQCSPKLPTALEMCVQFGQSPGTTGNYCQGTACYDAYESLIEL